MAIIKCPECGHQVSNKAHTCPSCGIEIAGKVAICPVCGEAYFTEQGQCPRCGNKDSQPVDETAHTQTSGSPRSKKKNGAVLVASTIIAIAICGVVGFLYFTKQNERETEAYDYARTSTDTLVLQSYLSTFPDAPESHRTDISGQLNQLMAIAAEWKNAVTSGSKTELRRFLDTHPESPHSAEAKHIIDSIDWDTATRTDTPEAYSRYMDEHVSGEHMDDALDRLQKLDTELSETDKKAIDSLFRTFFMALTMEDEEQLSTTLSEPLSVFLGKQNATVNDVKTYMKKLHQPKHQTQGWNTTSDYSLTEKNIDETSGNMAIAFTATEKFINANGESQMDRFKVTATITKDYRIVAYSLVRLIGGN
ncbi:MAG: zinc ribbon domain-containing protein [Prevotella sp.]